jgi:hypothetical protein
MEHARTLLTSLAFVLGATAQAQLPLVDATLVDNGNNELEMRIRPDNGFDGLFASIVFTVRWDAASGASIGAVSGVSPADEYITVIKSGPEVNDAGYRYQVFAGFGFTPLNQVPTSWSAGVEYPLITIPVLNGTSTFELVNDPWTTANNGDYYVSLNGLDQTGVLYQISTGGVSMGAAVSGLSLQPNPTEGIAQLSFDAATNGAIEVEVIDALGRKVHSERVAGLSGRFQRTLDLKAFGSGVYVVNVRSAAGLMTERLVVR